MHKYRRGDQPDEPLAVVAEMYYIQELTWLGHVFDRITDLVRELEDLE